MAITKKEAEKRTALYELEDELWKLVKRRAGIVAAIAVAFGFGGLWVAVELVVQRVAESPLNALQKEVIRAEVQADSARRASEAARSSSEQVTAGLNGLTAVLQNLADQAKAVESQFQLVSEKINAASENANLRSQRDYEALQRRISGLETLVKKIGEENAASRKATAEYAKQMAELQTKVEREQKRFAENSSYTIAILFDPSRKAAAAELQARLAAVGFRAPLQELSPNILKGNKLTYREESRAKAEEVLSLIKPIVRNVEATRMRIITEMKYKHEFSASAADIISKLKGGGLIVEPLFWNVDPKDMQLTLGVS